MFLFNFIYDYLRREKKKMDKFGENFKVIICIYELIEDEIRDIENDIGEGVIELNKFFIIIKYSNLGSWNLIKLNIVKFIE